MNNQKKKAVKDTASKITWDQIVQPDKISIHLFWRLFESTAMKDVNPKSVQYKEMRKAYMCGFIECFKFMSDFAGNLTEDQACEVFSRVAEESNQLVDEFTSPLYSN